MFTTPFAFMAAPAGGGYDPDAQAFFDRVTAAGGSLTETEEEAVNTLVGDLKSYSIWGDLQAVYPFVGASNASCRQNLISSSFTGTFNGSWTFSASGADPTGNSTYFDTGWNPSVNSDVMNNHYGVYITQNEPDQFPLAAYGVFDGFDRRWFTFVNLGQQSYYEQANTFVQVNNGGTNRGFNIVNANSGTLTAYLQGTLLGSVSYLDGGEPNGNFWFGRVNRLQPELIQDTQMKSNHTFGTLGYQLNSTKAGNYYTAVQAFQTTLGRQV